MVRLGLGSVRGNREPVRAACRATFFPVFPTGQNCPLTGGRGGKDRNQPDPTPTRGGVSSTFRHPQSQMLDIARGKRQFS